jgi:hypothetical protein
VRVVLDTSVLVAAALSRRGASFAVIEMIPSRNFEVCLSISLYLEWMAVLTREQYLPPGTSVQTTLGFLRRLASFARLQGIHYLWRPFLHDARNSKCPHAATIPPAPSNVSQSR